VLNPIKRALSCQGRSVGKYLGATKVPTGKRRKPCCSKPVSLITSHNQHSPPQTPLSANEFWGKATRLGARDRFGEWVKVAESVMVMVPGSVEDERMFSTLKYIRVTRQCNMLHAQHLTCCARVKCCALLRTRV